MAHFHYVMVGGTIMAYLGGLHFWWPKITGRLYPEWWARVSAALIFIGFNLTFFPQFILGYLGMPRRYHDYPAEFQVLNVMSSAGASILGVGLPAPDLLLRLVDALRQDRAANPWPATGLEWQTASPPPTENFAETPIVNEEAYDYAAAAQGAPSLSNAARARPLRHHFASLEQQKEAVDPRHVGVHRPGDHVLRRALRRLHGLPLPVLRRLRAMRATTWTGSSAPSTPRCSSAARLTMAMAVHAAALGQAAGRSWSGSSPRSSWARVFLGVKVVEYQREVRAPPGPGAAASRRRPHHAPNRGRAPTLAEHAQLYFSLYFAMTGLHALHMIIGIPILAWIAWRASRGEYGAALRHARWR